MMFQVLDPSCFLWAILRLYVRTLMCLIPLSICLLYSLLRLIKCNDTSEASILCSLAGCAFYGIVVSSLWKDERETSQQRIKEPAIALEIFKISMFAEDPSRWIRQVNFSKSPCPVCLEEYDEDDHVSYGERCHHVFHADCISQWTELHQTTCPFCRQDLQIQPMKSAFALHPRRQATITQ